MERRPTRRLLLLLATCVVVSAGPAAASRPSSATSAPAAPPPSLLLLTLDTTRADRIGCYGAVGAGTPNLDGLARQGTLFEEVLSPVPLTLPSHATLLTGRSPRLHGVRDNALFSLSGSETTLAERLAADGYATAAVVGAAVLDRVTGLDQGFATYDDEVRSGPRAWFNWEERAAETVTGLAEGRLGSLPEPFFLWVHYYDPHRPYVPPDPYRTRFAARPYDGEIAYMDAELGRLVEAARARAPRGGLLVAVAGDHGESLGDHGEDAHGVFVYQSTQRVPLILQGPGVPAGKRVPDRVGLIDLAPTILALLAGPALPAAEGRSLAPVLEGRRLRARDYELETSYGYFAFGWAPLRALVSGDLKLIDAPEVELYDLAADPGETVNLAPQEPTRAAALRRRLVERLGPDAGAPLVRPDPDGDVAVQLDRLRALGYVAGSGGDGGAGAPPQTAPAPGSVAGGLLPDPKRVVSIVADLDRGRALIAEGRPAEAAELLSSVLDRNPRNLPALLALGTAYAAAGQIDKALAAHRRAVERNPAWHLTHYNLATTLVTAGETRAARRSFLDALARNRRHAPSYAGLAELLAGTGDVEGARSVLVEAEREGVRDPELLFARGAVEAAAGDPEAADRAFAGALDLDPTLPRAHEARGRLAFLRGEPARAADEYRQELERNPTAAVARTLGSILLNELGDVAGAREAFRRALSLEPSGSEAPMVREMLRLLEGEESEGGRGP